MSRMSAPGSSSGSSLSTSSNPQQHQPDEWSPLLPAPHSRSLILNHNTLGRSRQAHLTQSHSYTGSLEESRHHSRANSASQRLKSAFTDRQSVSLADSKSPFAVDPSERVWYDQFTSTDWVRDAIADSFRAKSLRARKGFWGRVFVLFDGAQGWILSALVGFIVAVIAYVVDVSEQTVFDFKDGYCARSWGLSEKNCCPHGPCTDWKEWGQVLDGKSVLAKYSEFGTYLCLVVFFACLACLLTLTTKTVVPSAYRLTTMDENLAAEAVSDATTATTTAAARDHEDVSGDGRRTNTTTDALHASHSHSTPPPMEYYSAAGSGVAEVRVILSGFVLHRFLGLKTLVIKSVGLVLSVASGLSLGKEGPYVHIATCVGNIACRLFSKYDHNDGKRREVLSAAAAAGVAVAFGAPLGGVLFGLEEVAYFFPAKTLFRTFFCCITAALTLKFLNPYGTHKIVMFQVRYANDWHYFELASFILVGVLGGAMGALFIKASRYWAKTFRRIRIIKAYPLLEVFLVALVTGITSYWNPLTKMPVAKLLYKLAAPCDEQHPIFDNLGLCPTSPDEIPPILVKLLTALCVKAILTTITFGIKVPAGIYVPSMVVGGFLGRIAGHLTQWVVLKHPTWGIFGTCALVGESTCVQPGVYGLIAAGSTMCGVTRLSVTLAVILFEITGSLDCVLPFSLAILVAKWTADAMEPLSIYDLLIEMNDYPFLNNKHKPTFTSNLADILPRARSERVIDISNSLLVPATKLRAKLDHLHRAGELDGGLPIVRNGILVGLIPAPDLEYALDNLPDEGSNQCLMARVPNYDAEDDAIHDPTDFTPYIDPAPVALDIRSPMDLVYECFAKLGLRYICVLQDGRYAGMTHKKTFVKYMSELEEKERHR